MAVPYTFGSATTSIPLSQLDSNFATAITLGNTAVQLGNTITTLTGVTNVASSGSLTLGTSGNTTAVTIDTSQNVGIGTTSITTNQGKGLIVGNSSGGNISIGTNGQAGGGTPFYTDLSFRGYQNAETARIRGLDNSGTVAQGVLQFYTASLVGSDITERMRIDSSGNILNGVTAIGSANPGMYIQNNQAATTGYNIINTNTGGQSAFFCGSAFTGGTYGFMQWNGSTNASGSYVYSNPNVLSIGVGGSNSMQIGCSGSGAIKFYNGTETGRFDTSGNFLVGKTTFDYVNKGFQVIKDVDGCYSNYLYNGTGAANLISFFRGTAGSLTTVGNIQTTGSVTTFNSVSDYRLKENAQPMTDALSKVAQLKPVTYKWKLDGSNGQGFIAHELQEVVPDCVTGTKDEVDSDGNPVYQGIDTSFLVATLTAAIQELKAIVDAQATEIEALKAKVGA